MLGRIAAGAGAPPAPARRRRGPAGERAAAAPAPAGDGAANATPVAARMASAHGLDLGAVEGTGPRGRVTKNDVVAALEGDGAPAPAARRRRPAPSAEPIRGPGGHAGRAS